MSRHTYTSLKDVLKNQDAATDMSPKFKNHSIYRERSEVQAIFTNMPLDKSIFEDHSSSKEASVRRLLPIMMFYFQKLKNYTLSVVYMVRRKMGA